jgi:hypothetical protein
MLFTLTLFALPLPFYLFYGVPTPPEGACCRPVGCKRF